MIDTLSTIRRTPVDSTVQSSEEITVSNAVEILRTISSQVDDKDLADRLNVVHLDANGAAANPIVPNGYATNQDPKLTESAILPEQTVLHSQEVPWVLHPDLRGLLVTIEEQWARVGEPRLLFLATLDFKIFTVGLF